MTLRTKWLNSQGLIEIIWQKGGAGILAGEHGEELQSNTATV